MKIVTTETRSRPAETIAFGCNTTVQVFTGCERDYPPARDAFEALLRQRPRRKFMLIKVANGYEALDVGPAKPQQSCDHGLFSDEACQLDLVEMLQ